MNDREYRKAVDDHGDMVYRIALNQTRSTADADDITQAVFLKLYEKPPEDTTEEHLKAWLIRVTVNECHSLWRAFWRRRVELRDIQDADVESDMSMSMDDEGASLFAESDHVALYEALGKLPEKCRIVVHLFYFEDMSTRAIADTLGIKEPTVRTRLVRARKLLKQHLKEAWEDERSDERPGEGRSAKQDPVQGHDEFYPCSC